mgnify:FL=1
MVSAFDVSTVNPNPARFDLKKAEAINAEHVRRLTPEDFLARTIPYLEDQGVVAHPPTDTELEVLREILPHVQPRVGLLGEVPGMVGFLFLDDAAVVIDDDARSQLRDQAGEVLERSISTLEELSEWSAEALEQALRAVLVEQMEISPRHAFTPLRVAISGRRVSPPLFESMELLGKDASIARLTGLRQSL